MNLFKTQYSFHWFDLDFFLKISLLFPSFFTQISRTLYMADILICVSAKVFTTILFFTCRWRGGRVGGCRGQPGPGSPPAAAGAGLAKPAHQKEQTRITELEFLNILWGLGTEQEDAEDSQAQAHHQQQLGQGQQNLHNKRIEENYRAGIFKHSMGARNRVGGCR